MCVFGGVCDLSLFECVMTRGFKMPDRCVNDRTSHPDVPTKAAICPAVLPTELTTSVSAPASNIIHVMSVLPTGTKEEESGLFKIKYLYIKRVILTSYLTGRRTSAPCIRAHVRYSSRRLRVAAAACTCPLSLCTRRAWEGSSHTVHETQPKKEEAWLVHTFFYMSKNSHNRTSVTNSWFWQAGMKKDDRREDGHEGRSPELFSVVTHKPSCPTHMSLNKGTKSSAGLLSYKTNKP